MIKIKTSPSIGAIVSYGQRVQRLESEIKELNTDKSEIYKEARGNGFDDKALKVAIRKWTKAQENPEAVQEQDALVGLYLAALTGQPTPETRPAASQSPAKGKISNPSRTRTKESPETQPEPPATQAPAVAEDELKTQATQTGEVGPQAASPTHSETPPNDEAATDEPTRLPSGQPGSSVNPIDDGLDIPPFLDRRKKAYTPQHLLGSG